MPQSMSRSIVKGIRDTYPLSYLGLHSYPGKQATVLDEQGLIYLFPLVD